MALIENNICNSMTMISNSSCFTEINNNIDNSFKNFISEIYDVELLKSNLFNSQDYLNNASSIRKLNTFFDFVIKKTRCSFNTTLSSNLLFNDVKDLSNETFYYVDKYDCDLNTFGDDINELNTKFVSDYINSNIFLLLPIIFIIIYFIIYVALISCVYLNFCNCCSSLRYTKIIIENKFFHRRLIGNIISVILLIVFSLATCLLLLDLNKDFNAAYFFLRYFTTYGLYKPYDFDCIKDNLQSDINICLNYTNFSYQKESYILFENINNNIVRKSNQYEYIISENKKYNNLFYMVNDYNYLRNKLEIDVLAVNSVINCENNECISLYKNYKSTENLLNTLLGLTEKKDKYKDLNLSLKKAFSQQKSIISNNPLYFSIQYLKSSSEEINQKVLTKNKKLQYNLPSTMYQKKLNQEIIYILEDTINHNQF